MEVRGHHPRAITHEPRRASWKALGNEDQQGRIDRSATAVGGKCHLEDGEEATGPRVPATDAADPMLVAGRVLWLPWEDDSLARACSVWAARLASTRVRWSGVILKASAWLFASTRMNVLAVAWTPFVPLIQRSAKYCGDPRPGD